MSFGKQICRKLPQHLPKLPSLEGVTFGQIFAPVMLNIDWSAKQGWCPPELIEYQNLSIPPGAGCLHYALECFEGMKVYHGGDGKIRLFRPDRNIQRLQSSMLRLCFPSFDESEFLFCLKEMVKENSGWVPKEENCALYLRPTAIATNTDIGMRPATQIKLFVVASPAPPYFGTDASSISLYVDTEHHRAWPGGTGAHKLGANYAGPIYCQKKANQNGFQQVLWLGPDGTIDEVGAMNFMVVWVNDSGEDELITAPLHNGTILPGVTRDSILTLARKWGDISVKEEAFTITQVVKAIEEGRLKEAFGCGTAAVVTKVGAISYKDKTYNIPVPVNGIATRAHQQITAIQFAKEPHEWSVPI